MDKKSFQKVTGSLIKKFQVPVSDCLCTRAKQRNTLRFKEEIILNCKQKLIKEFWNHYSIPIPFLSWFEAKRTCDKFLINSMAGPFQDFADWRDLYDKLNKSPAMLTECESGGRYLHWFGYRYSRGIKKTGWKDESLVRVLNRKMSDIRPNQK